MSEMIKDSWIKADVENMKKSLAFYKKLGIAPSMQVPSYSELTFPGGTVLGLHQVRKKSGAGTKTKASKKGFGLMLRVRDLKTELRALKRKRIPAAPIAHAPGGADFSSIYDPDGNRLILVEMGEA